MGGRDRRVARGNHCVGCNVFINMRRHLSIFNDEWRSAIEKEKLNLRKTGCLGAVVIVG